MVKRKLIICCLFLILASLITSISYAKYVIECNKTAVKLEIDRTKPIGEIHYSTTEMTNGSVTVTINLSEPIKEVKGWILSEDKTTLTKIYNENNTENIIIKDLSNNENTIQIDIQNIDKEAPIIEIINIQNTNFGYENYANNTHTIIATIKISDIKINANIDIEKIDVCVGNNKNICAKTLKNLQKSDTEIIFDLQLNEIQENGRLSFYIPDSFVTDMAGNYSKETNLKTNITIDNVKPVGTYSQEVLQNGKVKAYIEGNEGLRKLEQWDIDSSSKILSKEFPANVSYVITITDYAQNTASVEVEIKNATYIVLTYASHNSEVGWTYGFGNYDIAGKEAIKKNPKYKTEALAFRITGGADKDFVRVRGYVHSYWNQSADFGICKSTKYKYKLKDAPSDEKSQFYSMASSNLSTLGGEKYIQLGGSGINSIHNRDSNGNNPIPYEALYDSSGGIYPYGVSGLKLSLADYSELSIVYQILVDGVGWLEPTSNGKMSMYSETKPMSAIRVAIIPNSEVDSLIELWNKDTYTYNVD